MTDANNKPDESPSMAAAKTIAIVVGSLVWGLLYQQYVASMTPTVLGVPIGEPEPAAKWGAAFFSGCGGVSAGCFIFAVLKFISSVARRQ